MYVMNNNTRVGVIIAIILVLAGGVYFWLTIYPETFPFSVSEKAVPPTTELPSGTDTRDEALEQDMAEFDAQLKALESESREVDESLSEAIQVQ